MPSVAGLYRRPPPARGLPLSTLVLGIYPNFVFNLTASSVDALVGAWRAAVGG